MKNGKKVDAAIAKGKGIVDDEEIGEFLTEVLTILVDLTWDKEKPTFSKSGKSSKNSSDPSGGYGTGGPAYTCPAFAGEGVCCETNAQCFCK